MLGAYWIEDVYIFDPDHSIIAYPFRLMIDLRSRLKNLGVNPLLKLEKDFLSERVKDKAGFITAMTELLQ